MGIEGIGRMLLIVGLVMLVIGGALLLGGKIGLGRLPGDIFVKRGSFTFYFPLVTSIVISLLLTLFLNLFLRR